MLSCKTSNMKRAAPSFRTKKVVVKTQDPLSELQSVMTALLTCENPEEVSALNAKLFASFKANADFKSVASRNDVDLTKDLDWATIGNLISKEKETARKAKNKRRAKRMTKLQKLVSKMESASADKQKKLLLKVLQLSQIEVAGSKTGIKDLISQIGSEKSGCRNVCSRACCYKTLGSVVLLSTGAIIMYYLAAPVEEGAVDKPWYACACCDDVEGAKNEAVQCHDEVYANFMDESPKTIDDVWDSDDAKSCKLMVEATRRALYGGNGHELARLFEDFDYLEYKHQETQLSTYTNETMPASYKRYKILFHILANLEEFEINETPEHYNDEIEFDSAKLVREARQAGMDEDVLTLITDKWHNKIDEIPYGSTDIKYRFLADSDVSESKNHALHTFAKEYIAKEDTKNILGDTPMTDEMKIKITKLNLYVTANLTAEDLKLLKKLGSITTSPDILAYLERYDPEDASTDQVLQMILDNARSDWSIWTTHEQLKEAGTSGGVLA